MTEGVSTEATSTIQVIPPAPSNVTAAPPWLDLVPDRKLLIVEAMDRGVLFVSWIRPGGARLSAEVTGGFQGAEKIASAIAHGPEKPLIVVIGREMYEGLPPKRPPSYECVGVAPTQATQATEPLAKSA